MTKTEKENAIKNVIRKNKKRKEYNNKEDMLKQFQEKKENMLENLEINIKAKKNYGRVKLIYLTRKG